MVICPLRGIKRATTMASCVVLIVAMCFVSMVTGQHNITWTHEKYYKCLTNEQCRKGTTQHMVLDKTTYCCQEGHRLSLTTSWEVILKGMSQTLSRLLYTALLKNTDPKLDSVSSDATDSHSASRDSDSLSNSDSIHSHNNSDSIHSHNNSDSIHSHSNSDSIHSHNNSDSIHSHNNSDSIHSHSNSDSIHSHSNSDSAHSHSNSDSIHSHSNSDSTHSHSNSDSIHSHSNSDSAHSHSNSDSIHSHSNSDSIHSHSNSDSAHSHSNSDSAHSHSNSDSIHSSSASESMDVSSSSDDDVRSINVRRLSDDETDNAGSRSSNRVGVSDDDDDTLAEIGSMKSTEIIFQYSNVSKTKDKHVNSNSEKIGVNSIKKILKISYIADWIRNSLGIELDVQNKTHRSGLEIWIDAFQYLLKKRGLRHNDKLTRQATDDQSEKDVIEKDETHIAHIPSGVFSGRHKRETTFNSEDENFQRQNRARDTTYRNTAQARFNRQDSIKNVLGRDKRQQNKDLKSGPENTPKKGLNNTSEEVQNAQATIKVTDTKSKLEGTTKSPGVVPGVPSPPGDEDDQKHAFLCKCLPKD